MITFLNFKRLETDHLEVSRIKVIIETNFRWHKGAICKLLLLLIRSGFPVVGTPKDKSIKSTDWIK